MEVQRKGREAAVIIMRDGGLVRGEGVQRGEGEVRGVKCHIYTCMGGEEVGEGGEGREEGEVTGGDWHCAVTGRRYSNNKKNQ